MSKNQGAENHVTDLILHIRSMIQSNLMFKNAIASKMNLNITDTECLDFLVQTGSSTAGDLARVTGLTTGAVTSVIDRLEKGEFVKRERNPDDRRKVMVVLIPAKNKSMMNYYDQLNDEIHKSLSEFSKKELKILISCMKDLNSIYNKHADSI
jgi:DNA-binding MarR family transcriptional regulator